MEPFTRIIIHNTKDVTTINCSNILSPNYRISQNIWISLPRRDKITNPKTISLISLEHDIHFNRDNSINKKGLYDQSDLQSARKELLFPFIRNKVIREIVRKTSTTETEGRNFELLLSPDHYKKATLNTMSKIWGKFLVFGQAFSGLVGIYVVLLFFKVLITQVLSTYYLYKLGGFTWKLLLGCFPFLAKFVIYNHHTNLMQTSRHDVEMLKIPNNSIDCKYLELSNSSKGEDKEQPKESLQKTETEFRSHTLYTITSAFQSDPRPHLNVLINNNVIRALIDTGASISIVQKSLLTNNQTKIIEPTSNNVFSANGEKMKLEGSVYLEIQIQEKPLYFKFGVMTTCDSLCILGMDILSSMSKYISFDIRNQQIYFHEKVNESVAVINEFLMLPPRTETFVSIRSNKKEGSTVLFEPSKCFKDRYQLDMPDCLCHVQAERKPLVAVARDEEGQRPRSRLLWPGQAALLCRSGDSAIGGGRQTQAAARRQGARCD